MTSFNTKHFINVLPHRTNKTFTNDEQKKNTSAHTSVTEEGIVICSNAKHPLKASDSIFVIEGGIAISFNAKHSPKAFDPIFVIVEGRVTFIKDLQLKKVFSLISFMGEEIEICIRDEQSEKALPISTTDERIAMCVSN